MEHKEECLERRRKLIEDFKNKREKDGLNTKPLFQDLDLDILEETKEWHRIAKGGAYE